MRRIVRLLSDWMLVELEPVSETTRGGIIKPDAAREPVRVGKVLMTGPGRMYIDKLVPMPEGIVGKRVAFMIAASQTKAGTERRFQLAMKDTQELIRLGDVLVELDEGVEVSGCG